MRRYVTRASVRWSEQLGGEVHEPHLTVYEPDDSPHYTGLLDAQGNELVAVIDRQPIGFDLTALASQIAKARDIERRQG